MLSRRAVETMKRRLGLSEDIILIAQHNLANTYNALGRHEEALLMREEVYSGNLKLHGEEDEITIMEANNYASSLTELKCFDEAKALARKTQLVARRVLGDSADLTLRIRTMYAGALYEDPGATLDDLRESVTTLEDTAPIARRVLGGAHPLTKEIEHYMQESRAALRARETP